MLPVRMKGVGAKEFFLFLKIYELTWNFPINIQNIF